MAEQLAFNDSLNLLGSLGTGVTTLGGTANVTYGTNKHRDGVAESHRAGLLTAQTYTNLAVTETGTAPDGVTPIYTLTKGQAHLPLFACPSESTSTSAGSQVPHLIDAIGGLQK